MTKVFFASTIAATLLTGCVVDEPTYGSTETETFEEWKAKLHRESGTGFYLVDWDVVIGEEQLYEHWQAEQAGQALSIYRINGADIKWSDTQKVNLTYCIGASFGANKQLITQAFAAATEGGWEKFANVNFIYVPSEDANCNNANNNVVFDVNQVTGQQYLARAFFPNSARAQRNVLVDTTSFGTLNGGVTLTNIMIHELGHALGFRHEHIARPGQATQGCVEDQNYRVLETYDQGSTMHYPQCGSPGNTLALSARDQSGVRLVYGAPLTNTAPTASVTQPSNGQQMSSNTFDVRAMVVDTDLAKVELFIDGAATPYQTLTSVSANGEAVFQGVTITTNGEHTLVVKATDSAGLVTDAQTITIRIGSGGSTNPTNPNNPGGDDTSNDVTGGCSTSGGSAGLLFALGLLGLAIRRRR